MARASVAATAMLALLALAGCSKKNEAAQTPPPPSVLAVTVVEHQVPNIVELPGRIEAVRTAEVRARVDGVIQKRLFEEGTDVRPGAPLFQIDPREKRAALEQAQAALQRAAAARQNAAAVVERYTPLVAKKAISAQEYDAAVSELRQDVANVAQAQAGVDQAKLQLDYATVRAPIGGRVGRASVTEGALVSGSSATLMTTVDQLAPVYATFTESSAAIEGLVKEARTGALVLPEIHHVAVHLILEDGEAYDGVGYLDFAGLSVDPSTGSQIIRAVFPNPQHVLLPGKFVRGRLSAGFSPNGVSVPQRAVQITDEQASVMTVDKNHAAAARFVTLGALVDGQWVIRSGLKAGDVVIVDGWQKVRPGQKVSEKLAASAGGETLSDKTH